MASWQFEGVAAPLKRLRVRHVLDFAQTAERIMRGGFKRAEGVTVTELASDLEHRIEPHEEWKYEDDPQAAAFEFVAACEKEVSCGKCPEEADQKDVREMKEAAIRLGSRVMQIPQAQKQPAPVRRDTV